MRALIIEDEALIAFSIVEALDELGYTETTCVAEQETAVHLAATLNPDLVTADVKLAKGCGIDAALEIVMNRPVPVVFVTGNAESVRARVLDPVVIEKPFTFSMLAAAIRQATSRPGLLPAAGTN